MQPGTHTPEFIPVYCKPVVRKLTPREKRIAKIKEQIAMGTYYIATNKLAKAMLLSF